MPDRVSGRFDDAVDDIRRMAVKLAGVEQGRLLFGIAGGPGTGKSRLAEAIAEAVWPALPAQVIPMDGFHMRHKKLQQLGIAGDKGAPHTFEADKFVTFIGELGSATRPVPGPAYSREFEDVLPDAYVVSRRDRLLIVEGNYLLLDASPWDLLKDMFDLTIFLEIDREIARTRLMARHAEHGLFSNAHIERHVEEVDMANFDLVQGSADRADLILEITETQDAQAVR